MADNIGDVGVGVTTDHTGFEARLRALLERIERHLQLTVPVNANTVRASAQLNVWRRLHERALEIPLRISKASLAVVSSQLASMLGFNAIKNALSGFAEHIKSIFDNIIPVAFKTVKWGAILGPLITLFGQLTIGAVELTRKLAGGLTAALIALPGLFALAAGSAFIFIRAFKDAPAVLGKALTQYKQIGDTISKNFWKTAAGQVKDFLNTAFPAINDGFARASSAAGNFTARLAGGFKEWMTTDKIAAFFDRFGQFWDILAARAANPLARITTNLLDWGSTLFPKIANWLGDIIGKFDLWLDTAIKTGKLDEMLKGLFDTIRDAWNVLKDGWSILNSISDAAKKAGISAFPLVTIMDNLARTMQTDAFQHGLTVFFEGAKRGAEGMKPAWDAFVKLVGDAMPMISKFIGDAGEKLGGFLKKLFEAFDKPEVFANFQKMFDGFLKVFDNLEPAIGPFADKIGDIASFMGTLADAVSKVLGVGIKDLAPIFGDILKKLEPLVEKLGDFFAHLIEDHKDSFEQIGQAIGAMAEAAGVFVDALDSPAIRFIIKLLSDFLATAVSGFVLVASSIIQIVGAIGKLLSGDLSGLNDLWEGIKKGLLGLWDLVLTLFAPGKILKLLGPLGKLLLDAIAPLFRGLGPAIEGFFRTIGPSVGRFFGEMFNNIPGIFTQGLRTLGPLAGSLMGDVGKWIVEGLMKGIKMLIGGGLVEFVNWIIDGVKNLLGIHSPSTVFIEIGQNIVQGLIEGIKALIDGVAQLFAPVVEAVKQIWQGLVDGIVAGAQWVGEQVATGWNLLQTVATTVWNTILSIVQTVWTGIQIAWETVSAAVQTGFQIIGQVAATVWQGIQIAWDTVSAAIQTGFQILLSVAQQVWAGIQAAFEVVSGAIQAGFQTILAVGESVWNGILAAGQAAWAAIQGAFEVASGAIQAGLNAIVGVAQGVWNMILGAAQACWDGIVAGAQGLAGMIGGVLNGVAGTVTGIFQGIANTITGIWNSISLGNIIPNLGIPGFAGGVENFEGGLAIVGEKGPELVRLPKGSDVYTNDETKSFLSTAKTPTVEAPPQAAEGTKGFTFAPTIYNPVQETTEQSLFNAAQRLAYLGLE